MVLFLKAARALAPPGRYFASAGLCAAGMLAIALGFQYLGGLAPCELCHWQRVPYAAVVALAAAGLLLRGRLSPAAATALVAGCAALFFADAAIAGFHVGVEQGWWAGTSSCAAADAPADDLDALREAVFAAPAVFCDAVAWSFAGLSMAGWNGLAALALGGASALVVAGRLR